MKRVAAVVVGGLVAVIAVIGGAAAPAAARPPARTDIDVPYISQPAPVATGLICPGMEVATLKGTSRPGLATVEFYRTLADDFPYLEPEPFASAKVSVLDVDLRVWDLASVLEGSDVEVAPRVRESRPGPRTKLVTCYLGDIAEDGDGLDTWYRAGSVTLRFHGPVPSRSLLP